MGWAKRSNSPHLPVLNALQHCHTAIHGTPFHPVLTDLQYLADMYAVHAALEESLAAAADAEAAAAGADGGQGHQRLLSALDLFGLEQGLARSAALLHDLQRLLQQPGSAQQAQQQQQPAGSSAAPPLPASQQAAAYAAYIASLARLRTAAEGPEEEEQVGAGWLLGLWLAMCCHTLLLPCHAFACLPAAPCPSHSYSHHLLASLLPNFLHRRCCGCWPMPTQCISCT